MHLECTFPLFLVLGKTFSIPIRHGTGSTVILYVMVKILFECMHSTVPNLASAPLKMENSYFE
jgi:hypothetical protein